MSKRPKLYSSIPSSNNELYSQLEHLTPSSASSKTELTDIDLVSIFLESLNAWLNGYFFSKLSIENSQLPFPPRLENSDLFETCKTLRLSIAKVREMAISKISPADKKTKEPEKSKTSPKAKSKALIKSDIFDDTKIQQILEETLKESRKKGLCSNSQKYSLYGQCEEVCTSLLNIGNELQIAKSRTKELETFVDSIKTRRIDESVNLNKSKYDSDCSLLQIVYPLVARVIALQEKKQFYSLLYRHFQRFLHHEEEEIKKLLETVNISQKRKIKLKTVFLLVIATIKIKKSVSSEEKMTIKGIRIKLLDLSLLPSKSVTFKTLPNIISSLYKKLGNPLKERGILNSLISSSLSKFQKFMNDIKTVLSILLKNNVEQKEAVITLTHNLKVIEEERDELEGA